MTKKTVVGEGRTDRYDELESRHADWVGNGVRRHGHLV